MNKKIVVAAIGMLVFSILILSYSYFFGKFSTTTNILSIFWVSGYTLLEKTYQKNKNSLNSSLIKKYKYYTTLQLVAIIILFLF